MVGKEKVVENTVVRLSAADMKLFQDLIHDHSGIHLDEIKCNSLIPVISRYLLKKDFNSFGKYYRFLQQDRHYEVEVRELISYVTINETSFFRNPAQFTVLEDHILPGIISEKFNKTQNLKIWSAGCATGEEPYSIAMTIVEKLPFPEKWDIEILATDIDYNVIKKAEKGIYNRRALRNVSESRQEKYFNQVGKQYALKQNVRKMVDFREFNLKQAVYPAPKQGNWDIIFCRNVIIYFDNEFTRQIIGNFGRCLDEKGHLFLGYSETLLGISDGFSIVDFGNTHAYKIKDNTISKTPSVKLKQQSKAVRSEYANKNFSSRKTSKRDNMALTNDYLAKDSFVSPTKLKNTGDLNTNAGAANGKTLVDYYLAKGKSSADTGDYVSASESYQKVLEIDPLCVDAHFFMALVSENLSEIDRAVEEYQKTIYVDDSCVLAHFNLARLYRLAGNQQSAVREYRNTVRKLQQFSEDEEIKFSGGFSARLIDEICHRKLKQLEEDTSQSEIQT